MGGKQRTELPGMVREDPVPPPAGGVVHSSDEPHRGVPDHHRPSAGPGRPRGTRVGSAGRGRSAAGVPVECGARDGNSLDLTLRPM